MGRTRPASLNPCCKICKPGVALWVSSTDKQGSKPVVPEMGLTQSHRCILYQLEMGRGREKMGSNNKEGGNKCIKAKTMFISFLLVYSKINRHAMYRSQQNTIWHKPILVFDLRRTGRIPIGNNINYLTGSKNLTSTDLLTSFCCKFLSSIIGRVGMCLL